MTDGQSFVKRARFGSVTTTSNEASEARYLPADVRRTQILDAAAELATTTGLDNTSIADVAKKAGLAKGSIYLHFESRQELISALQARVWSEMMEHPREIADSDDLPWAGRLDAVVEHLMRYAVQHVQLYHAVFHEVATDSGEPWDEARVVLSRLVAGGAEAGEFDLTDLNSEIVVEFLLHAYIGPCFHHGDIDEAVLNVQRLFRRTLGAATS